MAKKKKQPKAKEPIRIRFKQLSDGNQSIYLDCYIDGKRSYEFLKLYLIPNINESAKAQNANTMQMAQAIKAQRIMELANNKAGLSRAMHRSNILLHDWCMQHIANRIKRGYKADPCQEVIVKLLDEYDGGKTKLGNVNKEFCIGFVDFLNRYIGKGNKPLSNNTKARYITVFNAMLNAAVRAEIISKNPFSAIDAADRPHEEESDREYLSLDEIQKLIDTPCRRDDIKQAYLFSCFCGLRISDIRRLTWGNVVEENGKHHIALIQQKTQQKIYLPLSAEAMAWLPDRGTAADTDKVFTTFPTNQDSVRRALRHWVKAANINKHITFHTSRHTFATMMLTLGADLYTTSKLLGHSNIKVTQVYAKIVDKKKEDAVNLVNGLFNRK